ncbi:hypothetical protein E5288_WYG005037 [Bos mutus]|uniref:PR domain zinc finger protein 2 n=1 Tax=Bos mutus TaxID=72004 RepID=A0A6B0QX31_9CETA|nr:hypothetical protein [Bos mutus]
MNQNAAEPVVATETLAEVPEHVLRGLPEEVRLFPSAVDKTRIGVWATKPILKGKKFGPFVGDKKKRSQVKNNVYMWEVYYPNLGWMCIDATDPEKGNWLRYVNWACSGEEQNLFPLEINRAIYYKTLKPIAPGEELLVWYNGEDNPEIAAAIEEERASARSKRSSPKSRKVFVLCIINVTSLSRCQNCNRELKQPTFLLSGNLHSGECRDNQPTDEQETSCKVNKVCVSGLLVHSSLGIVVKQKVSGSGEEWEVTALHLLPWSLRGEDVRGGISGNRVLSQITGNSTVKTLFSAELQTALREKFTEKDLKCCPSSIQNFYYQVYFKVIFCAKEIFRKCIALYITCVKTNRGCIALLHISLFETPRPDGAKATSGLFAHRSYLGQWIRGSHPGGIAAAGVKGCAPKTKTRILLLPPPSNQPSLRRRSLRELEIRCDEKPEDLLEEPKTVSKETLADSAEAAPVMKTPRAREEANGDVFETFLFPCQHCERKFTTKQGLERHMHIHMSTVNHAFKCKYCGKAFGTQINRRRHERRHEAGLKRKLEDPAGGKAPSDGAPPQDDAQPPGLGQDGLTLSSEKASQDSVTPSVVEENGEAKELHPCKYCKKVFGTHTNMRRHQRRVHERHLIPKGVRRKGGLLEEPQPPAEQAPPTPSVYVPSTEPEEEGEADDVYIMDISSNISENLNYYIDGKIQTSSSTSNCDVIEMESNSADLYGINCLLTPVTVEITQNIKTTQVPITDDLPKEPSSSTNSESKKRRTASPPVLPKIKAETESDPATPSCSLSLPLSISTTEAVSFHKEKSVYLSSKLKQLLQTQDKLTPPAGISAAEIPKLGPLCVSAPASMLPVTSSRFKRRTSSPPSSPQHSPALRDFGKPGDGKAAWTEAVLSSKKPKLESHSNSPAWSLSGRDERETGSPPGFDEYKVSKEWAASSTFSNVCNQQPLDLSSEGPSQRIQRRRPPCRKRSRCVWKCQSL